MRLFILPSFLLLSWFGLQAQLPCEIFDLSVVTGDCNPNAPTYIATINFQVENPTNDSFKVWGNNIPLGVYPLTALPLTINSFPYNGGPNDVVQVCILGNENCCRTKEFLVPACILSNLPCEIFNLVVDTGDCTSDSTYNLLVNFQVANSTATHFDVWGNNVYIGNYPLTALPLTLQNFNYNGGANDVIKVCMTQNTACCKTLEFPVPACILNNANCEIFNLVVDTGDCTSDSTYNLIVNFQVANSTATHFDVWGNNVYIGNYALSALPLHLQNFNYNGGANDVIKVCMTQNTICCKTLEFPVPACVLNNANCEIFNLVVDTGDCTSDSTYNLIVNFQVANSTATHFDVWGNNVYIGNYALSALPLHLQNFNYNGGANDVIKVCMTQSTICCKTLEFPVPACVLNNANCEIFNLVVETGDCTGDSTYNLTVNFLVANSTANHFDVYGNGVFIGNYALSALPLHLQNFHYNGGANDVIKVCMTQPNTITCCKTIEFPVPACVLNNANCEIYNLVVETGDCTGDSTYSLTVNFLVANSTANHFDVYGNGVFIGNYALSALPLHLQNFHYNGGANDVIKVCMTQPNAITCCKTIEFPVPACVLNNGNCEIYNLFVETGECHEDSTYTVVINFLVANPTNEFFEVWGNGQYIGYYPLSALPLTIHNFHYNGGANDVVKVCMNDNPNCCRVIEFPVPACIQEGNCHIYDLNVKTTACLCGQFFAVLTFNVENGGNGGFDVVGNGVNYGNYPYAHSQPVIIGPLDGDGSTNYEFGVQDHLHPDCHDGYELGIVDCPESPTVEAHFVAGTLTISPNPTADWLTVSAQLSGGQVIGSGDVTIRSADGRTVKSVSIANSASFSINVSELPAATYHLMLETAAGRLQNTFVKL